MKQATEERRRAAGEGGFTLIELLVVIVILGILAAVVVFAVSGINDKGQVSACKTDSSTIRTAEEAYLANLPAGAAANYVPTDTLVTGGFLSSTPVLHSVVAADITAATPATVSTYQVRILTTACGVIGHTPNQAAGDY